ncbi:hypothetical protein IJJ08_00515 [bacterium]|nr:hypothetical protein [bacterium]
MPSFLVVSNFVSLQPDEWRDYLRSLLADKGQSFAKGTVWQFVNLPQKLLIDDVRELQTQLATHGHEPLVFVCTQLEQTSSVVQNSLLKMLEEPPVNVTLILTTTNLQAILPTIQSRCQIITDQKNIDKSSIIWPTLDELDFNDWTDLNASQIAQIMTEKFAETMKTLKKTHPDVTQNTLSLQAFNHYVLTISQALTTSNNRDFQARALKAFSQASKFLASNVAAKNVYYWVALEVSSE